MNFEEKWNAKRCKIHTNSQRMYNKNVYKLNYISVSYLKDKIFTINNVNTIILQIPGLVVTKNEKIDNDI